MAAFEAVKPWLWHAPSPGNITWPNSGGAKHCS
jgi:hypothetical protein